MADISDVEQAIVDLIAGELYPNGLTRGSVIDADCRIYRGWPNKAGLEADLKSGTVNVNVFPVSGGRNVTRYPLDWQGEPMAAPTLTATASNTVVTFGGTPAVGQIVALIVDRVAWSYQVQATDTLPSVAAALAALINQARSAMASGATVTIPASHSITARIGMTGTSIREVARFVRQIRVTVWAPDPQTRDRFGSIIKPLLMATLRLTMPDGTSARLIAGADGDMDDGLQKERVYRTTIFLSVEYAITQTEADTPVLIDTLNLTGGIDPNNPPLISLNS